MVLELVCAVGVGVADGGVADGSELGSGSGSLRFRVDVCGVEDEDAVDQRFAAPALPESTRPETFLKGAIDSRQKLSTKVAPGHDKRDGT